MGSGDRGPHLARPDDAHQVGRRGRRHGLGQPPVTLHELPDVLQRLPLRDDKPRGGPPVQPAAPTNRLKIR